MMHRPGRNMMFLLILIPMIPHIHAQDCGGEYSNSTGIIRHPLHGEKYKSNENCTWIIRAPVGSITIKFGRFHTESCCDHLTIRDGEGIDSNELVKLSGKYSEAHKLIQTTTNVARVNFKTDKRYEYTGFEFQWETTVPPIQTFYQISMDSEYELSLNFSANPRPTVLVWYYGSNFQKMPNRFQVPSDNGKFSTSLIDFENGNYQVLLRIAGITRENIETKFKLHIANGNGEIDYRVAVSELPNPPSSLQFSDIMPTSLWITCNFTSNPGDISYYMIQYKPRGGNQNYTEISGLVTKSHRVSGLTRSTEYEFRVLYVNEIGQGPPSKAAYVTTSHCGGEYNSNSGMIRHPLDGGDYKNNEHCNWIIRGGVGILNITFDKFETEGRYDILTIRDGESIESNELYMFSGGDVPGPVQTSTNAAHLVFKTDSGGTKKGFELHWEPAVAPIQTFYQVLAHSDYEVRVNFSANPQPTVIEWFYGLNFQEMPNLIQIPSDDGKMSTSLTDLENGNYQALLRISGITEEDIETKFKLHVANENGESDYKVNLSAFPQPPSNLQICCAMSTTVDITWNYSGIEGDISFYVIQYKPKDTDQDYTEISDLVTMDYTVRGLTPSTEYEFRLLAVNKFGRGLSSDPAYHSTIGCGSKYSSSNGTIHHPRSLDKWCHWKIFAGVGIINITIVSFDTNSGFKDSTHLTIRDGERIESNTLIQVNRENVPSSVQTTQHAAHLYLDNHIFDYSTGFELHWEPGVPHIHFYQIPFHSDYEVRLNFSAKPRLTAFEWSYGPNFQEMSNLIQIPSDNGKFSTSLIDFENGTYQALLKIYGITVEDIETKFKLHVVNEIGEADYRVTLSAFPSPPSSLNFTNNMPQLLSISWNYNYNPGDISYYVIQFKPNNPDQNYTEISGIVTNSYTLIGLNESTEYEFRVSAVNNLGRGPPSEPSYVTTKCGGEHNSSSGIIHHKLKGGRWANNENCIWIIRAAIHTIKIKFVSFSIDSGMDDLTIRDGDSLDSKMLCKFTGSCVPSSIQTTTNAAHLQFTSSSSSDDHSGKGFELHWEPGVAPIKTFYQIPMHSDYLVRLNFYANPEPTALKWSYGSHYNFQKLTNFIEVPSRDRKFSASLIDIDDGKYQARLRIAGITKEDVENNFNLHVENEIDEADYRVMLSMDEKPIGCGGEYNSTSGMIRFPLSDCKHKSYENCTWIIRAAEPIELRFVSIDIHKSDRLYVRDGDSTGSSVQREFKYICNNPSSIKTRTNAANLVFTSDGGYTTSSFELHWEPPVKSFYQVPLYSDYEVRLNFSANPQPTTIEWAYGPNFQDMPNLIQIPSDNGKFSTGLLDLENGNYQAHLTIAGIVEENLKNLYKLHIENEISGIDYRVILYGCGGEYNSSSGMIRYPLHGWSYQNNDNCTWIIRAGVGSINITFVKFSIEENDHLTIRDGESIESNVLGKFREGQTVLTSTSTAHLLFISDRNYASSGFELQWEPAVAPIQTYQITMHSDYEVKLNFSSYLQLTSLEWSYGVNFQEMPNLIQIPSDNGKFSASLIDFENGIYQALLKITAITEEDLMTKFKLHIANEMGEANYRVALSQLPYSPSTLQFSNIMATLMQIWWNAPNDNGNPVNISYVIKYKPSRDYFGRLYTDAQNYTEISGIVSNLYTVRGLRPTIEYEFQVFAVNMFGRGSPSEASYVKTAICGGEYNSSSGMIRHPSHDLHVHMDDDCTWIIRGGVGNIKITLVRFRSSDYRCADHLTIRDGESIESNVLGEFSCKGKVPQVVQTNTAHLHFTTDNRNYIGFELQWEPADAPEIKTFHQVPRQSDYEVRLNFSANPQPTALEWSYGPNFQELPNLLQIPSDDGKVSTSLIDLKNGNYQALLRIARITKKYIRAKFNLHVANEIDEANYKVALSDLPSTPLSVQSSDVMYSSLRITWNYINPGDLSYVIQYKPNNADQEYTEISDLVTMFYTVKDLMPATEYEFHVLAVNNIGRGQPSESLYVNTSNCGGEYNSSSGTIHHQLSDDTYQSKKCTWIIRVPVGTIDITFVSFDIPHYDHLYIRDGASIESNLLHHFKGYESSRPVQTTSNVVHLLFTQNTRDIGSKTGFELHWKPADAATQTYGIPLYSNYEARLNFSANPQPTILQWSYGPNFQNMPNIIQTPSDNGKFSTSLIDLGNGNYQALLRIARITKEDIDTKFKLRVANEFGEADYRLTFYGCGGEYNFSRGMIRHPLSGDKYQDNENCTWTIRAGERINITFIRIDTDEKRDYLYIRDGENIESNTLLRLSGRVIPWPVQTSTNIAHLLFTSNSWTTKTGFWLQWQPAAPLHHLKVPACRGLFTPVGDSCLLLAMKVKLTWRESREYCRALGADLVVIKDANHYADILAYIWRFKFDNAAIDLWIGGSDDAMEGHWMWVTGEPMPQGPPFWGSLDRFVAEPSGGHMENCAGLYHHDSYYIHDFACTLKHAPICQKIPPA